MTRHQPAAVHLDTEHRKADHAILLIALITAAALALGWL